MTEESGGAPPDLEPLTLRQKVANKRFNRQLENIVMPFKTLGFVGLGLVWAWAERQHKRLDRIR